MDEFANILQRDYGLKPQGKSAPMTSVKPSGPSPFSPSSAASTPASIQRTSSAPKSKNGSNRNSRNSNPILGESLDEDFFFGSSNGFTAQRSTYGSAPSDMPAMYDDVFGGPPKFAAPSYPPMPSSTSVQNPSSQSYDDIFRMPVKPSSSTSSASNKGTSFPVFDAPLYDDDIFGGVPGIRSAGVVYDDVFSGGSTVGTSPSVLEDLLGVSEKRDRTSGSQQPIFDSSTSSAGLNTFDDLLPGFGVSEPAKPRPTEAEKSAENSYTGPEKNSFGMSSSDPFDVIHVDDTFKVPQSAGQAFGSRFSDTEPIKGPAQSSGSHRRQYSNGDHSESIDGSGNSSPHLFKTLSPSRETRNTSKGRNQTSASSPSYTTVIEEEPVGRNQASSNGADEKVRDSSSPKPPERAEAPSFHSPIRRSRQVYDDVEEPVRLPKVAESRQADEYWISVEDVKLVTEPTTAPPPSRRPPLPGLKHNHTSRRATGLRADSSFKESPSRHESPQSTKHSSSRGASDFSNRSTASNPYDELEQFVSGVSRARKETKMDMSAETLNEEIREGSAAVSASTMAMKEAMERARSKLRERGKEEKESGLRAEETQEDCKEAKEDEEQKVREVEERQRSLEREAKALREREEREKRRREKEKEREIEREREREREREKDRIAFERAAVERANAEARERLAAEARQRAEAREQAAAAEARERAAVEKVTAEARERAAAEARERAAAEARERAAAESREKAAAERAAAEARDRAAAEARDRAAAERAASEARARAERAFVERVNAEARERAAEKAAAEARERAAAERAAAEARERAAAETRERAAAERAAAARDQQRRSENDLEAFFASSSRPASAPRQRSSATGTSDGRQSSRGFSTEGSQRTSTAAPSSRKVTPTSSTDDWTSLFGPAVPAAGEFQEFEGESEERRRARWERHQRTAERAAKALDEKNQRDLQSQREQAERHRAGDMLDAEIKRWAAGKEGNLRALLSTLQYVLWPECGWQAVSLTDLITAAAVKKVYRKATLCVHPDKVQQKGATIQQKYIAEKVFDLLKEAWNKFNSEELF